jgi:hypothetical protein
MVLSMKYLVYTACALATLALAAPAPEVSEMVQTATGSSVDSLKKQFGELQLQLKSGMEVTPGVKATIDTMTSLITNEIEPSIIAAHKDDQKVIDLQMKQLADLNADEAVTLSLLQDRATELRSEIAAHNKLVDEWEAASDDYGDAKKKYEDMVLDKTTTCCKKQVAGVLDISDTPPYAVCNYAVNSAAECRASAKAALRAAVQAEFDQGDAKYEGLKTSCANKAVEVRNDHLDMTVKDAHCDGKASAATEKNNGINRDLPQLLEEFTKAKGRYEDTYALLKGKYESEEARVKAQEADRHNEWDSTQEIKCMLEEYKVGGGFNEAALNKCKEGVNHLHLVIVYPAMVPPMVWELAPFEELASAEAFKQVCETPEAADEDADKRCDIPDPNPKPVCSNHHVIGAPLDGGAQPPAPAPADDMCEGQKVPFTLNDGVMFTWASPCSGGCSKPTPKCGWGICSDAQWVHLPRDQMKKDQPCSSKIFDAKYNHCDPGNKLVQHDNGGYDELVFCKNAAAGAGGAPAKCNGQVVPYTKSGGVYFTWASPCSGGCSKATPKCGWGICSNAQWAKLDEPQMKKDKPCSSAIFDKSYKHCDAGNKLVQHENNGYDELVFCYQGQQVLVMSESKIPAAPISEVVTPGHKATLGLDFLLHHD